MKWRISPNKEKSFSISLNFLLLKSQITKMGIWNHGQIIIDFQAI